MQIQTTWVLQHRQENEETERWREEAEEEERERQRKRKRKRKGETILEHQTGFCCGGKCSSILIGSPAGFAKLTDNRLTGEKSYTFI